MPLRVLLSSGAPHPRRIALFGVEERPDHTTLTIGHYLTRPRRPPDLHHQSRHPVASEMTSSRICRDRLVTQSKIFVVLAKAL